MKKYALQLKAVFDSKEELEDILRDIFMYSPDLDDFPNLGCAEYNFNIGPDKNEDVWELSDKLKLQVLLGQTDAFVDYGSDYQKIRDNILFYMSNKDVNYCEVKRLLEELTQSEQ